MTALKIWILNNYSCTSENCRFKSWLISCPTSGIAHAVAAEINLPRSLENLIVGSMGVPGEGGKRSPPRFLGKHGRIGNIRLTVGKCLSYTLKCTTMNIIVLIYYMIKLCMYMYQFNWNEITTINCNISRAISWQSGKLPTAPGKILAGKPMVGYKY